MPIPAGVVTPPPPPSGGGGVARPVVERRKPLTGFGLEFQRDGYDTIAFATKGGASTGWRALTGAQGTDLPSVEVFRQAIPDGHGSVHLGSRLGEREMFFRLAVDDLTYEATRDRMRALWAMVGDLQPFDVVIPQPEGDRWRFTCRYVTGLEGSYGDNDWWVNRRHVGVTVLALDPLAYSEPVTETWRLDVSLTRPFLSDTEPFFPVVLGESTIAGERVLVNTGDEDTWPVLVIAGPTSGDALVQNVTTGESLTVEGALLEGESVTIDGRPGLVDVYDQDGVQAWDRVPVGEYPWALVPGENTVRVTAAGATEVSSVSATWRSARRTGH